jgi:hypothetical protein
LVVHGLVLMPSPYTTQDILERIGFIPKKRQRLHVPPHNGGLPGKKIR